MEHFTLSDWSDFVRSAAPENAMQNMQIHLDSGCGNCNERIGFIRELYDFAQREKSFEPPAGAVRMAMAEFFPLTLKVNRGSSVVQAELSFDSFQHVQAGVRNSGTTSRHLLYKCGEVCVDMLLEPRLGSNKMVLTGQVVDSARAIEACADLPVLLIREGSKLSETNTNKFGEFSLGYETVSHLELFFKLTTNAFVVRLPEPQLA